MLLSALLAISFSLATILLIEIKSSGDLTRSEGAFYGASGVSEQALYNLRRSVPSSKCTNNQCYVYSFGNNVTLSGQPVVSNTTAAPFQDKVPPSTFSAGSNSGNIYNFCAPSNGNNGCGYGEVAITYLPSGNTNPLLAYLCQFNPTFPVIINTGDPRYGQPGPYTSQPCSDPTNNAYWLQSNNNIGGSISGNATQISYGGVADQKLDPTLQQELILTNPNSSTAPIYVSIVTFGPSPSFVSTGLPYIGKTSVTVDALSSDVGRKSRS